MPGAKMELGWDELSRYFAAMGDRVAGMRFGPALKDVAIYLASESKLCFDQQRGPDGAAWAPFASTPSIRRGGATAKLLRDTDELMASIIGRALGHVERVTDWSLTWGTDVDYAGFHQGGTSRMPARPFIGINPHMESRIVQILLDHAQRQVMGAP